MSKNDAVKWNLLEVFTDEEFEVGGGRVVATFDSFDEVQKYVVWALNEFAFVDPEAITTAKLFMMTPRGRRPGRTFRSDTLLAGYRGCYIDRDRDDRKSGATVPHNPKCGTKTPRPLGIDEPLWTVADVCRITGLSKSWVYREARDGTLPVERIGRVIRFVPDEIRAAFGRPIDEWNATED